MFPFNNSTYAYIHRRHWQNKNPKKGGRFRPFIGPRATIRSLLRWYRQMCVPSVISGRCGTYTATLSLRCVLWARDAKPFDDEPPPTTTTMWNSFMVAVCVGSSILIMDGVFASLSVRSIIFHFVKRNREIFLVLLLLRLR